MKPKIYLFWVHSIFIIASRIQGIYLSTHCALQLLTLGFFWQTFFIRFASLISYVVVSVVDAATFVITVGGCAQFKHTYASS